MRLTRWRACLAGLVLALTACHAAAPPLSPRGGGKVKPTASASSPSPASPSPAAPALLERPAGEVRELMGTVVLEARHALEGAGATLISDAGGQAVRFGPASLTSGRGGNLISSNGASILRANGAGLISDQGGGIISDNGAGIISDNGGGLIGNNGGSYVLLAATAPVYGTVLPGGGMALGVEDLTTGQLLTLGQDAAGHAAKAVYTDVAGGFHIYLPAAASKVLRIVSVPPAGADERLRSAYLTSHLPAQIALDEDTVQVANAVRNTMATSFYRLIFRSSDEAAADDSVLKLVDKETGEAIVAGVSALAEAFAASNAKALPRARALALTSRMADIVLSHVDLEAIPPGDLSGYGLPVPLAAPHEGTSLGLYSEVFRHVRETIGRLMAAKAAAGEDPSAYLEAKDYVQEAALRDGVRYQFLEPGDFAEFLDHAELSNPNIDGLSASFQLVAIFSDPDVGLTEEDAGKLFSAQVGINLTLAKAAYAGPDKALPELLATLERER